jgi:hypothetical protein
MISVSKSSVNGPCYTERFASLSTTYYLPTIFLVQDVATAAQRPTPNSNVWSVAPSEGWGTWGPKFLQTRNGRGLGEIWEDQIQKKLRNTME